MKRSTDRILLSHAGSLHRPDDLRQTMQARRDDDPMDDALKARIKDSVNWVVRQQVECGVDVVNDGEYTKRSWQSYARGRLSGLDYHTPKPGEVFRGSITAREETVFPEYFESLRAGTTRPGFGAAAAGGGMAAEGIYCVGPVKYTGQEAIQMDIDYMREAMQGVNAEEAFLSALAVGTIEHWLRNEYYKTQEEFLYAVADAMHEEYKAITDAGFILQLDDPDLPDGFQVHPELSVEEYKRWAEQRVEALNYSIRDCPEDKVRLHICWGSSHHPHTQDLPLSELIDIVYKVNAECYSIEQANPVHEWEWEVFKEHPLPDGKSLMPGVLGHCAREFVEHPETVAQRLIRYADVVGKENVIAGTDCGLQRAAHSTIMWAKFKAGAEGCELATKKLWGR
jgi:5-methyltetrahydropteroyltriglutamate--homocysteine methyltransferase